MGKESSTQSERFFMFTGQLVMVDLEKLSVTAKFFNYQVVAILPQITNETARNLNKYKNLLFFLLKENVRRAQSC